MAERDKGAASITPLDNFVVSYRPPPVPNNQTWFGPLDPMRPIAPDSVKGRILDYASGYNLNQRPRPYEAITFEMLRAFADNFDYLRILIETRKDQLERLDWNIMPRDKGLRKRSAGSIPDETQKRIDAILSFFLMPDKENFWGEWLRMLLEDLFVIDAPTIYRRKTYGNKLYALQPIDGGTIKRVIDDFGNTPLPPNPAYQQVLKGYPAVNYTSDELIYRPRVKRTHKVYGYSPVEQIIMTINIGMRRQTWQLQSFTEGNVPEALIGTPDAWTPDQVAQFQVWFDSLLVNNTGERRKARFVPGGVAKGYVPTKPSEIFGDAEEWLIRVMCFCFNISPQPFIKMMNRATAQAAHEVATAEGLAPVQNWVKGLMDFILMNDFESPDLEFVWAEDEEIDPDKKSQIIDRDRSSGLLTFNQARKEQGLDILDSTMFPNADRPMFKANDGTWHLLFLTEEEQAEKDAAAEAIQGTPPGGNGSDDEPDAGAVGDAALPPEDRADTPGRSPGAANATKADEIPSQGREVADKSDRPFVHPADCQCHLAKVGRGSGSEDIPDPLRPKVAAKEAALVAKLALMLKRLGRSIAKQLTHKLDPHVGKADDPPTPTPNDAHIKPIDVSAAGSAAFDIDQLLRQLDLEVLAAEQDELEEVLRYVGADAGEMSLAQIDLSGNVQIVDRVNERAVEYARERGAELVAGEDGLLADATRDMIRDTIVQGLEDNIGMPAIAQALEDNYAFSGERAELIAATEVTNANSMGSLAAFEEAQTLGIQIRKSWLILMDACAICTENADAGQIPLEMPFPSGDMAPGAHPNCRCVLVPHVIDEPAEKLAKKDNQEDMAKYFPVDITLRGAIWAMGGNTEEAKAERESSLLQYVPFDQCVATQDYCDHDKVRLYMEDPTAKGFAPMAYYDGEIYAIQDGHHRAVGSKALGNSGMSMNVKDVSGFD